MSPRRGATRQLELVAGITFLILSTVVPVFLRNASAAVRVGAVGVAGFTVAIGGFLLYRAGIETMRKRSHISRGESVRVLGVFETKILVDRGQGSTHYQEPLLLDREELDASVATEDLLPNHRLMRGADGNFYPLRT